MQDRPTDRELLKTLSQLLSEEVMPEVTGLLKHKVRVAANLCKILERESELGPALESREVELLSLLTGKDGTASELSADLCRQLEQGDFELEQRAWPALLEVVRGKLAVSKPGHDSYDFGAETGGTETGGAQTSGARTGVVERRGGAAS